MSANEEWRGGWHFFPGTAPEGETGNNPRPNDDVEIQCLPIPQAAGAPLHTRRVRWNLLAPPGCTLYRWQHCDKTEAKAWQDDPMYHLIDPAIATDGRGGRWLAEDTCPGSNTTHEPEDDRPRVAHECRCGKVFAVAEALYYMPFIVPPHPRGTYLLPE
jgi:hypothetical protein